MGSSNSAGREAEAAEAERRWNIQQTSDQINRVFDSPNRQKQYDDFLSATRTFYKKDLDEKNTNNNRQMKFAMARNGQTGSSVARDAATEAGKQYNRGLLEADRLSQGAEAELRGQDEQQRAQLLAMAQSGLDATSATAQASAALRNNLQAGMGTSTVKGIGDIFGGFADTYNRSRTDAAQRRGEKFTYDTLYGTKKPGY